MAGGVLPGYEVGGDFFDHACNAEGVWLMVADATGKGLAQAVDVTIRGLGDPERFLTAILALWDPADGELRWLACGHPPPLVVRADGTIEELGDSRTYPLGALDAERDFAPARTRMAPGDRLVLYSDGVTERRRDDGSFFGTDGVREVLARPDLDGPAATVRALQAAVLGASPAPMRDDATLLVLARDATVP